MDEIRPDITADLVAVLLRDQHPDLAELPITFGAYGWDNQMWRLGDDLAVRLPWSTTGADELLHKEYALLPSLAPHLPLPIPVPQRLGRPSPLFQRPWLVTTWVDGEPADRNPATRVDEAADTLADFLSALHGRAPHDAPFSRDGRGGPLVKTEKGVLRFIEDANERGLLADPSGLHRVWEAAVTAPVWDGPPAWLHADLHPANVLTKDGNFCGVIDFGDFCAGDPACDLGSAWLLLPDGAINRFHARYMPNVDAATQRRARGWALGKALSCLIIGDNGIHGRPGGKASWGPPAKAALERLIG